MDGLTLFLAGVAVGIVVSMVMERLGRHTEGEDD